MTGAKNNDTHMDVCTHGWFAGLTHKMPFGEYKHNSVCLRAAPQSSPADWVEQGDVCLDHLGVLKIQQL